MSRTKPKHNKSKLSVDQLVGWLKDDEVTARQALMVPAMALACGLVSSVVLNGFLNGLDFSGGTKKPATAGSDMPKATVPASTSGVPVVAPPMPLKTPGDQSKPTAGDQAQSGKLLAFSTFDISEVEDAIHLLKASRLFAKQQFKEAQNEVNAVSEKTRKTNLPYLTLASECYMATNQPQLAMQAAQALISLAPQQYNGYLQRAKVFKQQKKYKEAIADFRTTFKLFNGFTGKFGNRLTPEMEKKMSGVMRSVFIQQVGACYELLGDQKEATKQYEQGVTLATGHAPSVTAPPKPTTQQIATMKTELESLDEGVQRMPESLGLRLRRGAVLKALGFPKAAVDDYTRAISIASGDPFQIYYERAGAFYALGKYKLSAHDMRKVFRDDPLDPLATLKARGSMAAASVPTPNMQSLKTMKKIDDDIEKHPDVAENYYKRACAKIAFCQYAEAKNDFQMFLSLSAHSGNSETMAHACVLAAMCHDIAHRHASLTKEIVDSVNSFGEHTWLYDIYSYIGGKKNEEELLALAGKDRSKLAQANYYIGQHYMARDAHEKALPYFNAAIATGDKSVDEYFLAKLALVPELAYFAESDAQNRPSAFREL